MENEVVAKLVLLNCGILSQCWISADLAGGSLHAETSDSGKHGFTSRRLGSSCKEMTLQSVTKKSLTCFV